MAPTKHSGIPRPPAAHPRAAGRPSSTPALGSLIDDMLETMYAAPGIGLAATQVDVHQRLIVMDVSEERNAPLVFINPEILEREGEAKTEEGCLSVPGIFDDVERARASGCAPRTAPARAERDGSPPAGGVPPARDGPSRGQAVRRLPVGAEARRASARSSRRSARNVSQRSIAAACPPARARPAVRMTTSRCASPSPARREFARAGAARRCCARGTPWSASHAARPPRGPRPPACSASPVKAAARATRAAGGAAADAAERGGSRSARRAGAPDVLVVAAYGLILPPAVLGCRGSAASTSTPRCCRAGAARRRSSARSWPAMRTPASPSCRWTRASTPARAARRAGRRSARATRSASLQRGLAGARARALLLEVLAALAARHPRPRPQPADRRHLRAASSTSARRRSTGRRPPCSRARCAPSIPGRWPRRCWRGNRCASTRRRAVAGHDANVPLQILGMGLARHRRQRRLRVACGHGRLCAVTQVQRAGPACRERASSPTAMSRGRAPLRVRRLGAAGRPHCGARERRARRRCGGGPAARRPMRRCARRAPCAERAAVRAVALGTVRWYLRLAAGGAAPAGAPGGRARAAVRRCWSRPRTRSSTRAIAAQLTVNAGGRCGAHCSARRGPPAWSMRCCAASCASAQALLAAVDADPVGRTRASRLARRRAAARLAGAGRGS